MKHILLTALVAVLGIIGALTLAVGGMIAIYLFVWCATHVLIFLEMVLPL